MHTIASNPQDDPCKVFGTLLQQHRGIVGLLATCWLHRWARRPERATSGRKI